VKSRVEEIAQQEEIPFDTCIRSQPLPMGSSSLEEELLKANQEYKSQGNKSQE